MDELAPFWISLEAVGPVSEVTCGGRREAAGFGKARPPGVTLGRPKAVSPRAG